MGANRIKGITIEIGGDTTKLQTALKGVNSQVKSTQQQLKDVNKLLKLDPGNTELLAQKHKLLGDAVSQTKEKLATLKTAAEQANAALANGDISKSQYDALQRELIETENELKRLEAQANESSTALQKIAAHGEKLKSMGDSVTAVGQKFMPVTAAVVGLGTAAVKTAADFDSSMSKVAAVSGATGSDFDKLRDKAREMGAKTKFSASEAADAMNYMAMAGWKTNEMLSGIEGVMNLAAASGEDLATTSDIVTDALTAFGLTAADSGHFADILAAASSNANTNVSMMGETFKYAAPIAGALGYSAEDTAEAIGLMANAGIKGSQAGTSLRKIMTELNGDIKISGAAFGEMTIATSNADGSMRKFGDILKDCRAAFSQLSESEQAATAEALVGKTAMSGFLALMNAGESDIEKLSSAINNCDGSAEKMANTMQDNLAGQLTILKSQLQELAISFGEMLMPVIRDIVGWIQGFVNHLNSMDEGTRKMVITIGLVAAAIGPVLIVVGKIMSAVGTIMTVIPKLVGFIGSVKTAATGLFAVLAANPITLVIAGITALVAAFVFLWNNCEEFRQFWINLWENIKNIVTTIGNAIASAVSAIWNGIKNTVLSLANAIMSGISSVWNGLKNTVISLTNAIHSGVSTIWNGIKNTVVSLSNGIKSGVSNAWNGIKSATGSFASNVKSTVCNAWTGMKNTVTSVGGSIKSGVSSLWNNVSSSTKSAMGQVLDVVKNGFNNVKDFITNLASQAYNWGRDMIEGLVNGIRSAIGAVGDAVSSVGDKIRSFLHFSVPDEGPLTDYESWMPDFMKGLAKGIEKSKGVVTKAIRGLSADMVINPQVRTTQLALASSGIIEGNPEVSQADLSGMVSAIKDALSVIKVENDRGDIVIPVYLGGTMLDEVIVNAQQRANLRSGGR